MKYKPKEILCPTCNKKVGTWDGRSTIDYVVQCRQCRKCVIYHIENGEIEIKPLSKRATSSGLILS